MGARTRITIDTARAAGSQSKARDVEEVALSVDLRIQRKHPDCSLRGRERNSEDLANKRPKDRPKYGRQNG